MDELEPEYIWQPVMANWTPGVTPAVLVQLTLRQLLEIYEFIEANNES